MANKKTFLESFIVIMIIVAIIQIFAEDLSRLWAWNISTRTALIIIGFFLDLIFTIEFITRSILSKNKKGWLFYVKHEKGWVDFVSAVPLIVFNSGPIMVGMFWPGKIIALPFLGMLNILKVTKILRIARMLRLLRVLKIFKPADAAGERRTAQLSKIISIAVVTITTILILSPLLPQLFYNMDTNVNLKKQQYVTILQDWYTSIRKRDAERVRYLNTRLKEDPDALYMYQRGQTAVNNLGEDSAPAKVIPKRFFYTDYKVLNYLSFKLWYSIRDIVADNARINLLIETIIVLLIISMMAFYKDTAAKND